MIQRQELDNTQKLSWRAAAWGARRTAALGAGLRRGFEHVRRSVSLRAQVCICVHEQHWTLGRSPGMLLACQQSVKFSAPGHSWQ